MKLKNIVIKFSLFFKRYFLLSLLLTVFIFRFYFYNFPNNVDKDYKEIITLSNPLIIDDGTFVLKANGLSFYSHIPNNYDIGRKLKIKGVRKNNAVYVTTVEEVSNNLFDSSIFYVKNVLISRIKQTVLEPFSSLMLGMLYGVEPNFSKDFNDLLIRAGVIHVIVVSGYNITILFSIIGSLIKDRSNKFRFAVCLLAGIVYSYLVGFEPPVFRALVFGVLLMYGKVLGYKTDILYLLLITSLIMCIISPIVLISVSFQLSVLSTLGIILLMPLLEPYILEKINYIPKIITESFFTSLSAQLMVTPIILYYFKTLSVYSLLTNSLILWTVPLIMLLSLTYSVLVVLNIPLISQFILFLIYLPMTFFVDVVTFFANLPVSSFSVSLNIYMVFLSYLFLLLIIWILKKSYEEHC